MNYNCWMHCTWHYLSTPALLLCAYIWLICLFQPAGGWFGRFSLNGRGSESARLGLGGGYRRRGGGKKQVARLNWLNAKHCHNYHNAHCHIVTIATMHIATLPGGWVGIIWQLPSTMTLPAFSLASMVPITLRWNIIFESNGFGNQSSVNIIRPDNRPRKEWSRKDTKLAGSWQGGLFHIELPYFYNL